MWVERLPVQVTIVPSLDWDMAVLHVPGLSGPGRDVSWVKRKPEVGDRVNTLGWGCAAFHESARLRAGRVEAVNGREISLSFPVCRGDSGGPVFDDEGHLIGLISRWASTTNHNAVIQYLAE